MVRSIPEPPCRLDKSSEVRLLADGKAWARRAPCVQNLVVGARIGAQPLKQIENQIVDRVAHRIRQSFYATVDAGLSRRTGTLLEDQDATSCSPMRADSVCLN